MAGGQTNKSIQGKWLCQIGGPCQPCYPEVATTRNIVGRKVAPSMLAFTIEEIVVFCDNAYRVKLDDPKLSSG